MAKINFEYSTKLSVDESFSKLKDFIQDNADLQQLDKYNCEIDENSRKITAKGKKFEANLEVLQEGDASKVTFHIKLGLMLSPFKAVAEEKLTKKIAKLLG